MNEPRRRGRPPKNPVAGLSQSSPYGSISRTNALNGHSLPRSERNCGVCDHSRLIGRELRCWKSPPTPCMVGALPPRVEGQHPIPVIVGVQPPTWAWYCCGDWAMRQADHPDIGVVETVPLAQVEAELAGETRQ